jgi:hypothetical protein
MAVGAGIGCVLERLFQGQKTSAKLLTRAIYAIFYRRIIILRWSDPRACPLWRSQRGKSSLSPLMSRLSDSQAGIY